VEKGWATTLKTYTRTADVVYNSLNGTILSHRFSDQILTKVQVDASELRGVFQTLFSTSNVTSSFGSKLQRLGIGSNKPVMPFTIWQYFQGMAELSKNDSRADAKAVSGLQSLLAIPIYHCQAKDFAELRELLLKQINNSTAIIQTLGQDIINSFPIVQPDTDVYPATIRWSLMVGRGSLLAYIILAGLTLLLCIFVNCLGSLTASRKNLTKMGPFPLLNHLCYCRIEDTNGQEIPLATFQTLCERKRLREAAEMQVKFLKRK
jgi:hypothetical protein